MLPKTLASSSAHRTIKLWDCHSGECLQTFQCHSNFVWSIAFNPDGKTLASGSCDGTIKFWDVKTGECLKTLIAEGLYEGMNIAGVTGFTDAEKATIAALGAVCDLV